MHKGGYMDERRLDEHDPRFNPDDLIPYDWSSFLAGIGRAVLLALAAAGIVTLLGCEDFDRRLAEQEFRQKVFNACTPDEGQRIVVIRDKESLHFTTIDIGPGRYGRTFPHTEIRVATVN
jgi:hypothetical protein